MAMSPLSKKRKASMRKKVGAAAANVARKTIKAPTAAQKAKYKAADSRKRVKAIVQHLSPAQRKAAIKKLQVRKKARAAKNEQ
jgi:hypothetical protein